jgi:hypothetical protein
MNDDLRGRRVADAGRDRTPSGVARGRFAQVVPARKQPDQHTASPSFVSLLPSIYGNQQLVERDCGPPVRGRSLSFAA